MLHKHVSLIRDTIWFRATSNMLNDLGDLAIQTKADVRKHMDS